MIVFVDGIDGTGKSTLINGLLDEFAQEGAPAVLAPPLWAFLEPISAPEQFGSWVQEAPGADVGLQLLLAMTHRVDKLRADVTHKVIDHGAVILVDRGPKTVACSARAHAATGRRARSHPQELAGLGHTEQELRARIAALATQVETATIELDHAGTTDLVFQRLAKLEDITPGYKRYLEAFANQMAATPAWPWLARLGLHADARVDDNVGSARTWLRTRDPRPGLCSSDGTRRADVMRDRDRSQR